MRKFRAVPMHNVFLKYTSLWLRIEHSRVGASLYLCTMYILLKVYTARDSIIIIQKKEEEPSFV